MANIYARWIRDGIKNGKIYPKTGKPMTMDDVKDPWKEETRQILKDKYNIET